MKYPLPMDGDFDFILDDIEYKPYKHKTTQIPDITNIFSQTIKKDTADKGIDTHDEMNKIIGAYILQNSSKKFKSEEISRGELLAQARTVPAQQTMKKESM